MPHPKLLVPSTTGNSKIILWHSHLNMYICNPALQYRAREEEWLNSLSRLELSVVSKNIRFISYIFSQACDGIIKNLISRVLFCTPKTFFFQMKIYAVEKRIEVKPRLVLS